MIRIIKKKMFSSGNPLPKDHVEVAKRTRARIFEEERKKRIFNPHTRTIGVSNYKYISLYIIMIIKKFVFFILFAIRSTKMLLINKFKKRNCYKKKNK